jgi:hypothetical protein
MGPGGLNHVIYDTFNSGITLDHWTRQQYWRSVHPHAARYSSRNFLVQCHNRAPIRIIRAQASKMKGISSHPGIVVEPSGAIDAVWRINSNA